MFGGNGEMGMGDLPPIPIPISIWGWFSSPSLPISPFPPKKKSPNGDGDAGNWGPGEKCASLSTTQIAQNSAYLVRLSTDLKGLRIST